MVLQAVTQRTVPDSSMFISDSKEEPPLTFDPNFITGGAVTTRDRKLSPQESTISIKMEEILEREPRTNVKF